MENKKDIIKVTDPGVIKSGEKELIESIQEDLDWDAVRQVIANKVDKTTFNACGGEIVVHDGQIAFKVALEVRTTVSLLFDRQGNYIDVDDLEDADGGGRHPSHENSHLKVPMSSEDEVDMEGGAEVNGDEMIEDFEEMLSFSEKEFDASDSDEDIEALLKESREFWEKKKG